MCGIAGTINFSNLDIQAVKNSLFHRGPDEQNNYTYKNIDLIHTRLSIQDISHGQQPFEFKNYVIIFNGEIYNHMFLRQEYLKDFSFTTSSDTETLLYLYIKYKNQMFEMIDGMFAFCIFDKSKNRLILARDRAGKKPLYLYNSENALMFASELNSIKVGVEKLYIDEEAIEAYLRSGFFYAKYSPYKNVQEVDAGSYYEIDIDTLEINKNRYFDIQTYYNSPSNLDFESTKRKVDEILHKSVKDRLLSSDLEVGAFLSGGIDSSLIVAIASEYKDKLKTFTVKFDGAYDESHLAELTAKKYNTEHHTISINMNVKDDIDKILYNYGMPFMDSSAIPSYYVSQEAKKHVTVILNGDGADEIFAGYRRYVPIANNMINIASKFSYLLKILPIPHNKKSLYSHFYRLLSMSNKKDLDFYLSATTDLFEGSYKFKDNSILQEMNSFIKNSSLDGLSKQLYLDFNMLLLSDLLVKMDIATMAHSLEGRSPFLSKYMLEFVPTIKDNYKINSKTTKYILRELSKKYLSWELISQPKRGFEVPLRKWVENDLKDNIFDALRSNSYSSNFIDNDFIQKVIKKEIKISDEKRAKILWDMYCLESWKKTL